MSEHLEDRLMRYFDGELDEREALEVERLLEESSEARALLADFGRIGAELRAIAALRGAPADDVAERVMARIGAKEVRAPAPLPVRRATVTTLVPALALALAAAAAVALLVHPRPPASVARSPSSATQPPSVLPPTASTPPEEVAETGEEEAVPGSEEEPGASIESVDFGAQNGTIFMVASGPQVTPVVWLSDEGDESGGRMEPL